MVNTDLVIAKAAAVKKHLSRLRKKAAVDLETFHGDLDIQESVQFNLQMAIQNCIDIAAHIISDEDSGVAASNYISQDLTEIMVKAVGFRNLIAHEYAKLDLGQVLQTAKTDIYDLSKFRKAIFKKAGISPQVQYAQQTRFVLTNIVKTQTIFSTPNY